MKTQFSEVDAKGITTLAEKFAKNCMRLEKNLDPNPIQEKLKILVNQFKDAMPIVTALRNEKLEEHHWAQIKSLIKKDIDVSQSDFSLKSLIDMDVNQYQEEIVVISTQATQEANLKIQIAELEALWKTTQFIVEVDEKTEVPILVGLDDVYQVLDESLAQINMILGSRFVKPLRGEAEKWKKDILTISDMVEQWQTCQMNWRYLENIFMKAADIRKAMPDETKRFEQVDKSFKTLMGKTQKQPFILKIVHMKPFKTLDELTQNN